MPNERWNDQAIDGLGELVGAHGERLDVLDEALYREAARDARVDALKEQLAAERELATEERNVARRFRAEVRGNFKRIHEAHDTPKGIDWKTVFTLAIAAGSGIGVPFAIAEVLK